MQLYQVEIIMFTIWIYGFSFFVLVSMTTSNSTNDVEVRLLDNQNAPLVATLDMSKADQRIKQFVSDAISTKMKTIEETVNSKQFVNDAIEAKMKNIEESRQFLSDALTAIKRDQEVNLKSQIANMERNLTDQLTGYIDDKVGKKDDEHGLCRNCRQIVTREMEESIWPIFEIFDAPNRADPVEENTDFKPDSLVKNEEPELKRPRREIVSCFDTPGLYEVSSQSEPSLSQESSWSLTSDGQNHLNSGIHVLNKPLKNLSSGNMSPIKYMLQQPLECVQDSTKRYVKRKASEAVCTVLDHIAPGQSSKLLDLLVDDICNNNAVDKQNESKDELMNLILRLYDEADSNALKMQLLSIISTTSLNSKSQLLELIPGISKWKVDQSRAHATRFGVGTIQTEKTPNYRNKMDQEKLEHAMAFFLDPNFIQICSFGSKDLHFDNGDVINIPQVVRTTCHSALIHMYKTVCTEADFTPLSDSTLFKILTTCSAAKRSNLCGLDNITTDGTFAIENLIRMTETLRELGSNNTVLSSLKTALANFKLYLKTEYKFHVTMSNSCQTHCIKYALSNPGNVLLQEKCDHQHQNDCSKCLLLTNARSQLEDEIQKIQCNETRVEFQDSVIKDFEKIFEWKAHVLRTNNQEECRLHLLEDLASNQTLIVMDWAMKFLPALFREKQSDFFGQKGMSWHVTAAIFKAEDGSLKHRTFTHLFGTVKQDWFAVASALEHTLNTIKEQMPQIQEVFLRSDNAGCYHCGCLWLSLSGISERTGITVVRYDYSEAQAGKSICDAKIAHMRSKMRMYVSSGKNITTPFDMQDAIMGGTGVAGCQCAVVEVDTTKQTMIGHRIKGISNISNISFDGDEIITWQAYNIGIGNKFKRGSVLKSEQNETGLKIVSNFQEPHQMTGNITRKERRISTNDDALNEDQSDELFYCTVLGCTGQFSSYQSLQDHINLSRHSNEKMSTYDKIRHRWVANCQANLLTSKEMLRPTNCSGDLQTNSEETETPTEYGWALKKERKFVRFSKKVKEYLQNRFQEGEKSGRKANASDISKDMKSLRKENGEKFFNSDDWLQPSQIASYFARLSIFGRKDIENNTEIDEDLNSVIHAIEEQDVRNLIAATITE